MDASRFLERAMEAARGVADRRVLKALGALASHVDVALDEEAGTARIMPAEPGRFRIDVSPSFVRRYVRTDGDALYLLLHELLHRLRGDFLRRLRAGRLSRDGLNVALDIGVNAHLARLAFPEPPPMVRALYPAGRFPDNLLLPPTAMARACEARDERWHPFAVPHDRLEALVASEPLARATLTDLVATLFRATGAPDPPPIAALYVRGWLGDENMAAFVEEFAKLMERDFPSLLARLGDLVLLGDHRGVDRGEVQAVLGGVGDGLEAGHSDRVRKDSLGRIETAEDRAFFEAVRRAVTDSGGPPHLRQSVVGVPGVVGLPGRREAAFLALGYWPAFWRAASIAPEESCERVHVYLDVSGSTQEYQRLLYGLTLRLGDEIGSPVYLFSNAVEPVTLGELEAGQRRTTGGTDFDCVIAHALDRNFTRVVVVTDGMGPLGDALVARARIRGLRAFVVLTHHFGQRSPLLRIAEQWWTMPALVKRVGVRRRRKRPPVPWGPQVPPAGG
ncbi:MAG: hypothetical protein HY905_28275 [Deltaproteobacteria bacterium]|nr:hypothetical protein [Deltaproteobacteria bacterium]